jgi:asparagine synthase (glutamine-hydrolysing)
MSAFAGIVSLSGSTINSKLLDRAAAALTSLRKGRTVHRSGKNAVFVERTSLSDVRPPTGQNHRGLFASLARLDYREELAEALGLTDNELAQTSDTALLQRMFERWGDTGVARCVGAFAFAHWDGGARRLTLGRDCLGNSPLFYHCGPEFICFATTLGALFALPGVPRAIDEIALANFLALNMSERVRTFYRGIERVPSRSLVSIDNTGIHRRYYWAPDLDAPPPYKRDEDYVERARELFDIAVAAATRDTPRVAVSTSGGLDSSAIAATVAQQGALASITCFCMVPPLDATVDVGPFHYLDERDKVEELGRRYPNLDIRFIAPDRLHPKAFDDTLYFMPANLPSLAPATFGVAPYKPEAVAAAGHHAILIGNYGNFGLTWAGRFSLLELLRTGQWRSFARDLPAVARESERSVTRTLAGDVVMHGAPIWLRRLIYRLRGRDPDSVAHYSALNPSFIMESGLAQEWRTQGFDPWFGPEYPDPKRTRAYRLFDHNQYSRDVRGLAPEIFGHSLRDPHADRRLLEFALLVPERMYNCNGVPRAFARRVFADRLPPAIVQDRRHGANTPTWFRALDARRADIIADIDSLEASPLASRLLDLPRLKRLMDQWPKDADEAEKRRGEYRAALARGVHVGRFIRWVEGGNA